MLSLVITLLLALHLLCVNVASGGPLLAAWLDLRGTWGDDAAARGAAYLARHSIAGLLAGAALGLLIGWLKWNAEYRSLWLGPLSYKLHWAAMEAVFSLLLMLGWWWSLPGRAGGGRAGLAARAVLAVLAATNLLYHFPVLFASAARLLDAGETSGARLDGAAFRRLMVVGETPALAVHVALASVAVAGVMLLGLALRWGRQGEESACRSIARTAGRWALVCSALQLPVGLWTLMALPAAAQSELLGSSATGVLLLALGVAAALWLINELVQLSMGEFSRAAAIRTMAAMLITVLLMTAMQQQTRRPIAGVVGGRGNLARFATQTGPLRIEP